MALRFDEIGYWSEIKLEIIRDYAAAYSKILKAQNFKHAYIDGFAGAGQHRSETTGELVPGSPLHALRVDPPFSEYYLVDLNRHKTEHLRSLVGDRKNVSIYNDDCNEVLLKEVFPKVRYKDFKRGLCILDPYGLHLNWDVIKAAGESNSLEIFLNFPVMDMNMNVLWRRGENPNQEQVDRMNFFWGDDSWKNVAYQSATPLFPGIEDIKEKTSNVAVAKGFQERLKKVAGFKHVLEPLPMTNTLGKVVYYLYFATQKPVAENIVQHIFNKYRDRLR